MRFLLTCALSVLAWRLCGIVSADPQPQQWIQVTDGLEDRAFQSIAIHPSNPTHLVAASQRTVYQSLDSGRSWHSRFQTPHAVSIHRIAIGSSNPPTILVATDGGLFGSLDGGTTWSRLFRGLDEGQAYCTHVAFHPSGDGTALLGTHGGLFMTADHGKHWALVRLPADAKHVVHFAFDPHERTRLYVVTANGLFIGDLLHGEWQQRVATLTTDAVDTEEPRATDTEPHDEDLAAPSQGLNAVVIHPQHPSTIYLAGARGLMVSEDQGNTWRWLTSSGLESPIISSLLLQVHSPLVIYAGTARGIARYESAHERWSSVGTSSPPTAAVHDLAAAPGILWAATADGLYRYDNAPDPFEKSAPPSAEELLSNFVHEPTITQVQQAAIQYAEVHPNKIKRWRRQAAFRALLPTVDFGIKHTRVRDASIDEGTFPKFQVIDTEDRNAGADLSVRWDLGNLIWNNDQISIDTRSRFMVQLRDDVLSEVTRTYFERRRLQIALLLDSATDPHLAIEKELRVRELTALIDGLTGGEFSKQMRLYTK